MNRPSPGQSPATALERSERRPTATILFLGLLIALPMGTCGGMGAWKTRDLGRTIVATEITELASTADGAYVSFDGTLQHVATDELPLDATTVALARGMSIFALEGAPAVYIAAQKGSLPSGKRIHVAGRVCSADTHFACSVDDKGVRLFLRTEAKRTGRSVKVVTPGATPRDNIFDVAISLGIAGILALVLVVVVAVQLRGRRRPLVFVERVVPLRSALDFMRVREVLGAAFRPAHVTAGACTLLTGVSASRAQLLGAYGPDDIPQRVEIWREGEGSGYRQLHARIRVSEIFAQPVGLAQVMPSVQTALHWTLERVVAAVNA